MRNGTNARNWLTAAAGCLLAAATAVATAADRPVSKTGGPPPQYTIRVGHPRIFADAESFRRIAARCGPGGPLEASYKALVTMVDPRMDSKNAYYPRSYCGPLFGFAYRIETDSGRDGSRFLRHIKEVCWKKDGTGIDGLNIGWDAILYDWIYDAMTPEERTLYGNRIGAFLRHYTNVPEITLQDGTYWYNQTWGGMATSWSRDGISLKTMVALVILGEKTDYQDDARRWLDSFAKRMPEEFVKKFDLLGGIWPEGPNHGGISYAPFLTWEAWRFATGQNLFEKVARTGFHRENPYWPIYGTVPHTGHLPHNEDVGPVTFAGLDTSTYRAMHAARYRDGITQGSVKSLMENGKASWADMICYDPSVPVVKREALPLAFHFRGSGHVYMRSAWQGGDDTWAMFTAAPAFSTYGSGAGTMGAFQIAKQGTLAGVAGYQHQTSAAIPNSQNVVLVYDPKEKYYNRTGAEVSRNDGGPQSPNFAHALEPVQRGEIVAYEHNDAFTYVAADLTRAYSSVRDDEQTKKRTQSQKINEFTRQFLYVRGTPEFFVVYDRVRATNAAFPKTWLTHLQDKPEILGPSGPLAAAKEGPGFKTYQGAEGVLSRVVSRDGKYFTTKKRGAVGIRTLLPKQAQITVRGGEGFEMWGNPHDPKASNGADPERQKQSDIDLCLWRVEVEPPDRSDEQHFLHVLVPYGDAAGMESGAFSPGIGAFKLVENGAQEGVSLETTNGSWTILFNRQGPPGGAVSVRQGAAPAFTATFTNEVKPNAMPAGLAISSNSKDAPAAAADAKLEPGFTPLFNGIDLTGWTVGLDDKKLKLEDVCGAADGVMTCTTKSYGWVYTERDYTDFVLKLEWRWPQQEKQARAPNSGVFLRMGGPPRKCYAAGLSYGGAGDLWTLGRKCDTDPKRSNKYRCEMSENAEKPYGEWNEYVITADGGDLTLEVNGKVVNKGAKAEVVPGHIGLQLEVGSIQFRNIRIKELKP